MLNNKNLPSKYIYNPVFKALRHLKPHIIKNRKNVKQVSCCNTKELGKTH